MRRVARSQLALLGLRQRARRTTNRLLGRLRNARYIHKWLALGLLIGVVAGLGAVVFIEALHAATTWVLGDIGGFHVATTAGEGGVHAASGFARPWAVPLVVGAGAGIAALLVARVAPEAEGHGTDAAISAVHHHPTTLRPRVAAVKIVASALTIGSGGSGGREGPTAQISATFGSVMARVLNLSPADARIAVASGIASGIGAIFRAPLGGAVLGAELVYRDDVEVEALIPSVIASIVAFAVFGSIEGFSPIFGSHTSYQFAHVVDLGWFAVLGIAAGAMGRLYAITFYGTAHNLRRIALPAAVRPALAGALVGLIGLGVPAVLGTGYGFVQQTLDPSALTHMALWLVLLTPFAKIVATSLSIGSGGSGGIFGPGMVIGGATGAAVWRLVEPLPAVPHSPAPYVIVGMISCFGAVAHAPLAVMLMVAEMTGNLSLLAPAMVALALATLVVGDTTIYRSQPRTRADSPAHRASLGLPLAATIPVGDVMMVPRVVLTADTLAPDALDQLTDAGVPGAPVVDADGRFVGSVHATALNERVAAGADDAIGGSADAEAITVAVDAGLDAALEALATSRGDWVPVLDADMHVAGIVGTTDMVRGYRLALRATMRRLSRAAAGSVLLEVEVGEAAPAAGRRLADAGLPAHTVVVAVLRRGDLYFADSETVLHGGDTVTVLTRARMEDTTRGLLEGPRPSLPDAAPADDLV
jgi:H+/Cl- antiporter ClcA